MTGKQVILLPEAEFSLIVEQLASLGWLRVPDPTAPQPIIPGEPEIAEWRLADTFGSDARLIYTFEPATALRALRIEMPRSEGARYADELARQLPILTETDILALLDGDNANPIAVLRGIQAARLLRSPAFIAPLNGLLDHPNRTVAREARAALAQILRQSLEHSAIVLKGLSERATAARLSQAFNPTLFAGITSPRQRRQALRWMMHDRSIATPEIEAVLDTALNDADWEVRVTAMLAAGRLRASGLRRAVQRVELPSSVKEGVDSDDRRILAALRAAVLALLVGEPIPEADDAPPADRAAMTRHTMRCAAGAPVRRHDRVFLLAYSLTTPFDVPDTPEHRPPASRPGVSTLGDRHWLDQIELIWIPPVESWLGDDMRSVPIPNPIRLVRNKGYFVACDTLLGDRGAPLMFSRQEAIEYCEGLSKRLGARIRLPSADEWELAARGTDGRRFPWGNAFTREFVREVSPWGMQAAVGVCAQWTTTTIIGGVPVVCGDVEQLRCSVRKPAPGPDARAALRLVIDADA